MLPPPPPAPAVRPPPRKAIEGGTRRRAGRHPPRGPPSGCPARGRAVRALRRGDTAAFTGGRLVALHLWPHRHRRRRVAPPPSPGRPTTCCSSCTSRPSPSTGTTTTPRARSALPSTSPSSASSSADTGGAYTGGSLASSPTAGAHCLAFGTRRGRRGACWPAPSPTAPCRAPSRHQRHPLLPAPGGADADSSSHCTSPPCASPAARSSGRSPSWAWRSSCGAQRRDDRCGPRGPRPTPAARAREQRRLAAQDRLIRDGTRRSRRRRRHPGLAGRRRRPGVGAQRLDGRAGRVVDLYAACRHGAPLAHPSRSRIQRRVCRRSLRRTHVATQAARSSRRVHRRPTATPRPLVPRRLHCGYFGSRRLYYALDHGPGLREPSARL